MSSVLSWKRDTLQYAPPTGMGPIPIAYKVLTRILCERLKPLVKTLIGPHWYGFRSGKSTIDQIFTLSLILEKINEPKVDTHHLFVAYKAAFDSPIVALWHRVFATMSELGVPAKLIRPCRMTLNNSCSSVKVGTDLSEPFDSVRGFREGDSLSFDLFAMAVFFKKVSNCFHTLTTSTW